MARELIIRAESWPLARPFAISRGVKTAADVVVVEIDEGGARGWAECVPYPRYDETIDSVTAEIEAVRRAIEGEVANAEVQSLMAAGAARNAVDCALWDLRAKQAHTSVAELCGLGALKPEITAETIGIGTADEMGARAAELKSAPLLKIKLDAKDIEARLDAIRAAAPDARLIVDPNEGWTAAIVAEKGAYLKSIGVEMLEQPVPAGDDEGLRDIESPVALCADEALHTSADLERLQGKYDMVNIKLDKTGGLTEALALKAKAEGMGFGIMVGCMVGTSLAMAPAQLVAQGAKIVDLDGPLLLKEDRNPGLDFTGGMIHPPRPELWG
ncbi:MAG: L-Ala-D/L-Glu epimerase [Rhodospirillales bacterium]|nr:L-Ala-D/L-Glu epimerase [Rhodospirillales bacterium]MBO6787073.1 L-Ala-D/L-Glu epimerase [Rhodospirillales bacterium]